MKTLDIIDRNDLKRDYKKTDAWIKRYGRMAGGYGKPMTWIRSEFEAFETQMRHADRNRRIEAAQKNAKITAELQHVIRHISTAPSAQQGTREMRGRGGRGQKGRVA